MNIFYTKEHEWVKVDGNNASVGISHYAADELGDITFVELPEIDFEVEQSDVLCGIESVKAASDIFSPLSGKVVEVNDELEEQPELVNDSPEEEGWIAVLEMSDPSEVEDLMNQEDYEEYIKSLD